MEEIFLNDNQFDVIARPLLEQIVRGFLCGRFLARCMCLIETLQSIIYYTKWFFCATVAVKIAQFFAAKRIFSNQP